MSTKQEHPREGCLFSAMSSSEKIALRSQCIFYSVINVIGKEEDFRGANTVLRNALEFT